MKLTEMYDFKQIVNAAEDLVIEEIAAQLPEEDWENEDLVFDIATYALNQVSPMYRYTLLGKMYSDTLKETDQYKAVRAAVGKAIAKIKKD
jgi:competence protein ComFB